VHHAYSKHAEVTVPSLDDWERTWQKTEAGGQRSVVRVPMISRNMKSRAKDGEQKLGNVVEMPVAA
jgi:hypothetical protein